MMFSQVLFDAIRKHHQDFLLSDNTRRFTGDDLLRSSNSVAQKWLDIGIKPGERVGISLRDQFEALIVFLGLLRVGAVPLFIDFRTKANQKSTLIDAFKLVAMLDDGKAADYHRRAISYDNNWLHTLVDQEIFALQPTESSGILTVSSGTTGLPKAYVLGDKTISARMINSKSYDASTHTGVLVAMPLASAGTHNQIFPALLAGVEVIFMPLMFSTQQLISKLSQINITCTMLPPPIVHSLLNEIGEVSEPKFPNLKLLKCSGGALDVDKIKKSFSNLTNGFAVSFGASANGVVANLRGEDIFLYPNSAGRIESDVVIEAIDPVTHKKLPTGHVGLLTVRSSDVADAIISAEPTDEKVESGCGISGDIGYVNDEGFVFITGRLSDVIVRAGVAVSPSAIENTLKTHPDIDDVAVVGITDDRLGHDIAAMIVAPKLREADVRQFIMENIEQDKRPRKIRMVKALPYTRNGKLDRKAIQKMFT